MFKLRNYQISHTYCGILFTGGWIPIFKASKYWACSSSLTNSFLYKKVLKQILRPSNTSTQIWNLQEKKIIGMILLF